MNAEARAGMGIPPTCSRDRGYRWTRPLEISGEGGSKRRALDRVHGSHHILTKDELAVPVPVHGSRDLGPGLIAAIQRQSIVKLK
jgi:hypothetical protein